MLSNFQRDLMNTIHMLYMNPNKGSVYAYAKTITNILKGNLSSHNALMYKDSAYFGLYKKVTVSGIVRELNKLSPEYIEINTKGKRIKYGLSDDFIKKLEADDKKRLDLKKEVPEVTYLDVVTDNAQWNKIEQLFHFPSTSKTFPLGYLDQFDTIKDVKKTITSIRGDVYLPNVKKEVAYESKRGELMVLKYLDKHQYIKDIKSQSLMIPYGKYQQRKYYPDFIMQTHDDRVIICEVKAITNMSYHLTIKKYEALKKYCIKHGYGYGLIAYQRDYYSFEYLSQRTYNKQLEKQVLTILKRKGKYTHDDYVAFKKKTKVHHLDIHTIVIKNGLKKISQHSKIEIVNK